MVKEGLLGFAILISPVGLELASGDNYIAGIAILALALVAIALRGYLKVPTK